MECTLKDRQQIIENYLNDKLTLQEREAFEEHWFNCDRCYYELRLREELVEVIKEGDALDLSEQAAGLGGRTRDKTESFLNKIFPITAPRPAFAWIALAFLVVISGLAVKYWLRPGSQPLPTIAEHSLLPDSSEKIAPAQESQPQEAGKETSADETNLLFAANFQPSPIFEEMLSTELRSAVVQIETPLPGQTVTSENILFKWQSNEAGPFFLKILNNRGKELTIKQTKQQQVLVTMKLPPGLYYWKLETEEDLLYLGKFILPVPEKE